MVAVLPAPALRAHCAGRAKKISVQLACSWRSRCRLGVGVGCGVFSCGWLTVHAEKHPAHQRLKRVINAADRELLGEVVVCELGFAVSGEEVKLTGQVRVRCVHTCALPLL